LSTDVSEVRAAYFIRDEEAAFTPFSTDHSKSYAGDGQVTGNYLYSSVLSFHIELCIQGVHKVLVQLLSLITLDIDTL
jgi:hypothetical protein